MATNWSDLVRRMLSRRFWCTPIASTDGRGVPIVSSLISGMQIVSKAPVYQQAVKVNLQNGLHLRPQSQIVRLAQQFECDVNIRIDDRTVDAKSMFDLMTLKAAHGTTLYLEASGANADEAIRQLADLFESNFEGEETSSS